ncbi:MAG: tripartite tricarboxylate transporter substrate-binding protein [Pseudomonadota bacterium]
MQASITTFCLAAVTTCAPASVAQSYPTKPVRLLASGIGGGGDFTARMIASGVSSRLGQQVIVDNRPGGVTPGEILSKAQPDGHTLMLVGFVIWLAPFMRDNVPFDPVRDFAPITLAVSSPNVLVVHPSVPVKSVRDLIALAKQKPGALNVASSGLGNSNYIAAELFKVMAGVNIVSIPYKGAALALNDVLSGRVEMIFATANASGPHVSAGRLTALGVTSARPSSLVPGLPTVAASGLPGYESAATLGILTRTATPAAIVNRLNSEIVQFLKTPEISERLFKAGIEVVAGSPEQFAAVIKHDIASKGKLIKSAGIRME